MIIKAAKLVSALTSSVRGGVQSALIDLETPGDAKLIKSLTWDGVRNGLVIQLQDGRGVTSKDLAIGQVGQRLFVPAARIDYVVEVPEPAEAPKKK